MVLAWEVIGYIGVASIGLYVGYKVLRAVYNVVFPYFLLSPVDLHEKAGAKWAVVTGATDGIGKSYARQLAGKNFNVLLVSRTQSKLDDTKREIERESPDIEIRTFAFDLTAGSAKDYKPLISVLDELEVGILVNNVGMFYEYPEIMHLVDGGLSFVAKMSTCNMLPVVVLSTAVLPQMVARNAGVIINISSGSAYMIGAYWNVYSATKRFVVQLSEILHYEYESLGITVQTICPNLVSTKMSKNPRAAFFTPGPDDFVKGALRTVGLARETTGYFAHQIQFEMLGFMPAWLTRIASTTVAKQLREEGIARKKL